MPAPRDPQPVAGREHWPHAKQGVLWDAAKRILVREAMHRAWSDTPGMPCSLSVQRVLMGCLLNESRDLPDIGRRVTQIERSTGTVLIHFDDGSSVAATVSDPRPQTDEEQEAVERVHGTPAPAKSCGCKQARCKHAQQAVDMVAVVKDGELLRAMDANRSGAENPRMWGFLVDGSFDMFRLHDVPLSLAVSLSDFGSRGTRLRDGRQAWVLARRHAEPRPFRRVRV